jgi:hypothetical protein
MAPNEAPAWADSLKPLADKFWWVPWMVLGVIGWRWIKEKL